MVWTYSGDPENSNRDAVRLLIGDTDTSDQQLTDAEIAYFLAQEAGNYGAASSAAKSVAGKYARLVDKSVDDLKYSYSQRQKHYLDLAADLAARQASDAGQVYVGGISVDDKKSIREDTDAVQPAFTVDQDSRADTSDAAKRLWNTLD